MATDETHVTPTAADEPRPAPRSTPIARRWALATAGLSAVTVAVTAGGIFLSAGRTSSRSAVPTSASGRRALPTSVSTGPSQR